MGARVPRRGAIWRRGAAGRAGQPGVQEDGCGTPRRAPLWGKETTTYPRHFLAGDGAPVQTKPVITSRRGASVRTRARCRTRPWRRLSNAPRTLGWLGDPRRGTAPTSPAPPPLRRRARTPLAPAGFRPSAPRARTHRRDRAVTLHGRARDWSVPTTPRRRAPAARRVVGCLAGRARTCDRRSAPR